MMEIVQSQMPVSPKIPVNITVNGDNYELSVEAQWSLAFVLREKLGLTGTKSHCEEGACGYCTVIIDGKPILSCMTLAATMDGKSITTIEGLAEGGILHPIQEAWIEEHGAQCGYCTPGFILSSKALLDKNPAPSTEEIKDALEGNVCRCGNYENILNSVKLASDIITGKVVLERKKTASSLDKINAALDVLVAKPE